MAGPDKKRRKKKSRTQHFSDDDSSDSDIEMQQVPESHESSKESIKPSSDKSHALTAFLPLPGDVPPVNFDFEEPNQKKTAQALAGDKKKQLDHVETVSDAEFEAFYLSYITKQLGDDLNELRTTKDFSEDSVPLIVEALKTGSHIYDAKERAIIMQK